MWLLSLLFLGRLTLCEFSITFPNVSDVNELARIHEFYQPSPLVDSIASLGIHAVTDLLTPESNVVISPLNIFCSLDILHLGAAGETRKEIDNIVGHSKNDRANKNIIDALHGIRHASAVFLNEGLVPKKDFIKESYLKYQTEVINVNFTESSQATFAINGWVYERTNGTIQDILWQDLDPSTELVMVNALLFNGKWLHPFSPSITETGRFEIDDQNFVNIPIMHLEANLPVISRAQYDAIGLPYRESDLVMYVILPHNHGFDALKNVLYSLSPTDIKQFSVYSQLQFVLVQLPKFKIDGRYSLRDPLIKQGLKTGFIPGLGNFTNFTEQQVDGIFISDILHSIHFEVNEHETIASAASAFIHIKKRPILFKATRPFIFVITNNNGILLFMGIINRPS